MKVLKSEDQLLASSDLIEFEWYKETKIEGTISITVQLTRHFHLFNEADENLQKRRQKAQRIFNYFKFKRLYFLIYFHRKNPFKT